MCEIVDLVERHENGARSDPWTDRLWHEAHAAFPAQDLCAQLVTLDHYGLGDVGCALVDGLLALAVRSKHATPAAGCFVALDGATR
jgi:hypothetical protein